MSYLATGKEELYYEFISGDIKKPAIVLLHSLGTDHHVWRYQIESLAAEGYTLVAPDSRGHGRSSYQSGISVDAWVDDIFQLINHLSLDQVVLCGVSMGGVEAMAFALKHPQRVAGLILADTFAELDPNEVPNKIKFTAGVAEEQGMGKYADTYLDNTLSESQTAAALRDCLRDAIAGMELDAYKAAAESCFSIQLEDRLDEIAVPTLILIGEDDLKTPIELSKKISSKIANSELKIVSKGRHLSNVDEPDSFNQLTIEFLNHL